MVKPLVSIIVPIYNVERYVEKCVRSVLSQDYSNFELILVDDGSPDGAGEICDDFEKKDRRIRVIHKKNGGVSSARNAGLNIAKGEYIMFIDGDDWVDTDHVSYLLYLCQKYRTPMSMSYGIHTKNADIRDFVDYQRVADGVTIAADLLYHKTVIGSYNKMFSRALIYNNKVRFDEELFIGEGFNFIVMCAQLAGSVATGRKSTYHYRLDNAESAMTKFNIDKLYNNDMALVNIKRSIIATSPDLTIAWHYARWLTSLNFSVWMKVARADQEHIEYYRQMSREIRSKALWVFISRINLKRKLPALLAILSPKLAVYVLGLRRKRLSNV